MYCSDRSQVLIAARHASTDETAEGTNILHSTLQTRLRMVQCSRAKFQDLVLGSLERVFER